MDSPAFPPAPSRLRLLVLGAIAMAAAAYGWFIYQQGAPYAGGTDSSGYLNSARLLAHGRLSEPVRSVPGLTPPAWSYQFYQPLGTNVDAQTGRLVPSYPIGLPLHYAIAAAVVGLEKTARVVNALNALAAGALLFALGRQLGLRRRWALAGVALLWACPVWIYQSLQPMSDSVATTWTLAAILCAWRARDRPAFAPAAGAAFACAVLVRPTSLVLALPLAVALGGNWRSWAGFALGGLPGALGLGACNLLLYGRVLGTGYEQGTIHVSDYFSREYFHGNLLHFAIWVPRLLTPPIVALAAFGLPWLLRRNPRAALLLASWMGVLVGLYSCYFCAGETWWYLRFLLPAFPALLLAALLMLQRLAAPLPGKLAWLVPAALLAACVALQVNLARELRVTDIRDGERTYLLTARWLRAHLPPEAILLTMQLSGAVLFYNDQPIVRWDQIQRSDFERLDRTAAALHRPIYAPLFPFEKPLLQERIGGNWTPVGQVDAVTIWRLAPAATGSAAQ